MAMGKRQDSTQGSLFIPTASLARSSSHAFYERLNQVLAKDGFDAFSEGLCAPYYVEGKGRPGIPPGTYFRMHLAGYFEGLESERLICWRVSDSLALRPFLGYDLTQSTPDHSTLSRIRQRLPVEVHLEVFTWILQVLSKADLLKGKTLAVDATTLEANAALRSLCRRDSGLPYEAYLTELANESDIETPTREELTKGDKKRKKTTSNDDWEHPHDPDAKVTKMKDKRTHLAHKAEHVVDLETQAVVAVNLGDANEGDTASMPWSLLSAELNLEAVAEDARAANKLHERRMAEVVADKGYHSNEVLGDLRASHIRSHVSEPGTRSTPVEGQGRGPGSGVWESTASPQSPWPTSTEAPRRDRRTGVCPRVRHRWHATSASTRTKQHPQASAHPRRWIQPESNHAQNAGCGHATGVCRPRKGSPSAC